MAQSPPRTMQAAQYDRYGDPDVLELRRVAVPVPGLKEVLVRVHASGLNPKDAIIRSGFFKRFSGRVFPKGTGFDFAGEISEVGAGAEGFRPGQKVWGFLDGFDGGAAAEYVAVPQGWLASMPEGLPYTEAASLPLVGLTALQALRDKAGLKRGEKLLIKGASGGVGSAAIQLAKALGAHVTAVASTASLDHCRSLGADEVVDYVKTDPTTLEGRFDVFLDLYGGSPYVRYRRLLKRGGRFVTIAPSPSLFPFVPLSRVLPLPKVSVLFVKPNRSDLETLARYVKAGSLRMPVEATYTLETIREAHRAVAEKHTRGKRVLLVREPVTADAVDAGAAQQQHAEGVA